VLQNGGREEQFKPPSGETSDAKRELLSLNVNFNHTAETNCVNYKAKGNKIKNIVPASAFISLYNLLVLLVTPCYWSKKSIIRILL
jgi:hypothetical protein